MSGDLPTIVDVEAALSKLVAALDGRAAVSLTLDWEPAFGAWLASIEADGNEDGRPIATCIGSTTAEALLGAQQQIVQWLAEAAQ